MSWTSRFNWQQLSSLKGISVRVPLSQLSILKHLMTCIMQVWMQGPSHATINPLRENLGSILKHSIAAVAWKLLTPFTSPVPSRHLLWKMRKCINMSRKNQKNNWHLETGCNECNYNRSWRSMCVHQAVVSTFQSTSGYRQPLVSCNLPARFTIHPGAKDCYLQSIVD